MLVSEDPSEQKTSITYLKSGAPAKMKSRYLHACGCDPDQGAVALTRGSGCLAAIARCYPDEGAIWIQIQLNKTGSLFH